MLDVWPALHLVIVFTASDTTGLLLTLSAGIACVKSTPNICQVRNWVRDSGLTEVMLYPAHFQLKANLFKLGQLGFNARRPMVDRYPLLAEFCSDLSLTFRVVYFTRTIFFCTCLAHLSLMSLLTAP